ncbi:MAG: GNAT family N-acetyltransferase, partial [Methyloligellaceae bacterium]
LAEPFTQYANVLVDPDADADLLLQACWQEVCRRTDIDCVSINAVPQKSSLSVLLDRVARRSGIPNETARLDLTAFAGWESYQSSLSSSLRRGRTKRRNKLARTGHLEFVVLWAGDQGYVEAIRDAISMKRQWLHETGRFSYGMTWADYENFLLSLPGDSSAMEGLIVHALRRDDQNIAIELGFVHHGHYYCFLGGFDWSVAALSPGKVQIEASIKWFMENGMESYDFLPNPAAYKSGWTNEVHAVHSYTHVLTERGRMLNAMAGPAMRHRVKTLYYLLPQPVRNLAGSVLPRR